MADSPWIVLIWIPFILLGWAVTIEYTVICAKTKYIEKRGAKTKRYRILILYYFISIILFIFYPLYHWYYFLGQVLLYSLTFYLAKKYPEGPRDIEHLKIK